MTVPTLSTIDDWNDTWALIRGLWPKWEPTSQQSELWEDSLRPLSQERVRRAVKSAASSARWKDPAISTVAEKYHGAVKRNVSQHKFTEPPYTMAEVNAEAADMRRELLELDADTLAHGVEAARPNLEMLGRAVGGVDIADPATWPNGLVGFVWAAGRGRQVLAERANQQEATT